MNHWPIADESTVCVANILEVRDINLQEGKANRVSYWASLYRFVSLHALKAKWAIMYGFGKAGFAVSWMRGVMLLSSNKSCSAAYNFRCSISVLHLQTIFFFNFVKTLRSAQWLVFDATFSLALSYQPTHPNPHIMLYYLYTLYSQSLAIMEYNINIHEKCQIIFSEVWNTSLRI